MHTLHMGGLRHPLPLGEQPLTINYPLLITHHLPPTTAGGAPTAPYVVYEK